MSTNIERIPELAQSPDPSAKPPPLLASGKTPVTRAVARRAYREGDIEYDVAGDVVDEVEPTQSALPDPTAPPLLQMVKLVQRGKPGIADAPPLVIAVEDRPAPPDDAPDDRIVKREPIAPLSEEAFYRRAIDDALESISGLARDRHHIALSERAEIEARLLTAVDGIAVCGEAVVRHVVSWWRNAVQWPGPWSSWAACFVLGCLAGGDALLAVLEGIERLPEEAHTHGLAAAHALHACPHPDKAMLLRDLLSSPHPMARAVAIEMMACAGQTTAEQLQAWLREEPVAVVAAALRAAARLGPEEAEPLHEVTLPWLDAPRAELAWPAARALLRWGRTEPYNRVCKADKLAETLGLHALEVLVLVGTDKDAPVFATLAGKLPASGAKADLLARFGHTGAWARLLYWLTDEWLANDAADALVTLFGERVSAEAQLQPNAWKDALNEAALSPALRYRRGAPYSPAVVADECMSGALSCAQIALRLDELCIRAGMNGGVELAPFDVAAGSALQGYCTEARQRDALMQAGSWTVVTRQRQLGPAM